MTIRNFDHVTVAVSDLAAGKAFFELFGFKEEIAAVISGPRMEAYMGVGGIEADHLTLALPGAVPRLEVQLLHFRRPEAQPDATIARLDKLGYNHICFAVDDIDAEIARLRENGVTLRNEVMTFHDRKLVYLNGPDGITVELAQWV